MNEISHELVYDMEKDSVSYLTYNPNEVSEIDFRAASNRDRATQQSLAQLRSAFSVKEDYLLLTCRIQTWPCQSRGVEFRGGHPFTAVKNKNIDTVSRVASSTLVTETSSAEPKRLSQFGPVAGSAAGAAGVRPLPQTLAKTSQMTPRRPR
ncbi:hypothetical protein EVAR_90155_1 [Eumeta japonica]|uniref:Uncharacterized protein n=1 Tax=Eumeta variegata TaxID=151549 RepID=A0A4C1Z2Z8_EUMVA|nr:hypothetical protein EVAR_90155_1 [Eumeta japonica]